MNVVVYCSANPNLPQEVTDIATNLGKWIGENRHSLFFGGVNAGLMHITAQAACEAGCQNIVGIVPECFEHRVDKLCTQIKLARDLNHRKALLINEGDVFVVLPGGLGTIDEWISTLSQQVVDGTNKPIIVVNLNNMFTPLAQQLQLTAQSQFSRSPLIASTILVDNTQQLLQQLSKI